jgi:predicted alpha/beta-hydrolase family hydrolase
MEHPFLATFAEGIAAAGVGVLRYQFPYMEQGARRVDSPAVAQATVRVAVAEAQRAWPRAALAAGGKSFGGRMTSQAQAAAPLPGVAGLVFLGFPLHAAGKPSDDRAAHLFGVQISMLFCQGTRDALAEFTLLEPLVVRLGARATLHRIPEGDHSFHVPARSGRRDADVLRELVEVTVAWIGRLPSS